MNLFLMAIWIHYSMPALYVYTCQLVPIQIFISLCAVNDGKKFGVRWLLVSMRGDANKMLTFSNYFCSNDISYCLPQNLCMLMQRTKRTKWKMNRKGPSHTKMHTKPVLQQQYGEPTIYFHLHCAHSTFIPVNQPSGNSFWLCLCYISNINWNANLCSKSFTITFYCFILGFLSLLSNPMTIKKKVAFEMDGKNNGNYFVQNFRSHTFVLHLNVFIFYLFCCFTQYLAELNENSLRKKNS